MYTYRKEDLGACEIPVNGGMTMQAFWSEELVRWEFLFVCNTATATLGAPDDYEDGLYRLWLFDRIEQGEGAGISSHDAHKAGPNVTPLLVWVNGEHGMIAALTRALALLDEHDCYILTEEHMQDLAYL